MPVLYASLYVVGIALVLGSILSLHEKKQKRLAKKAFKKKKVSKKSKTKKK